MQRGCQHFVVPALAVLTSSLAMTVTAVRAAPIPSYVAATANDGRIHFLDSELNDIGGLGFPTASDLPNDVAVSAGTIYSVHYFNTQTVYGYDFSGNVLFHWDDSRLQHAQGMAVVNGQLAVANGGSNTIDFYNNFNTAGASFDSSHNLVIGGALPGGSAANPGSSSDAITFDGTVLWEVISTTTFVNNHLVVTNKIVGVDPTTNLVISSFADPANSSAFGGTGLTTVAPGELVVVGTNGEWYKFSDLPGNAGQVLESGNNSLNMYGIAAVPEPSGIALCGLAGSALLLVRRRRDVAAPQA